MIRVLIADDHPIVRAGLRQVLARATGIAVAAEAGNGQEILDGIAAGGIDVVVMDFSMPGKSGLDVIRQIRQNLPRLPILVLSMHPENGLAPRLLKAGASGYLQKESATQNLEEAIHKLASGGRYVSSSLAEKLAADLSAAGSRKPHEELSDREFQVLLRIVAGRSQQEIADELSLSVKTVRTYRDRIMEKMSMKNDVELTRYALDNGLLPR
jgi:two-component system invasion response regulator UvrY